MKENKKGPGGQPPFYNNPEEFMDKANEYFSLCEGSPIKDNEGNPILDKYGNILKDGKNPTISGLAYFMGFASKQSLYDYAKKEEYSYPTSRIRLFIESSYEQDLRTPGISPAGPTFALKNMGWSDKQELQHSTIDDNGESIGILQRLERAYDKAGKDTNL